MQKKPINKEGNSISSHWVAVGRDVHDRATKYDEQGARIGDTPNRICLVEYPYGNDDGKSENARLIAAAPELLASIKWAINLLQGDSGTGHTHWQDDADYQSALSAIAKAEGGQA